MGIAAERLRRAGPARVQGPERGSLGAVARITRAENCAMAGVATLVGAGLALPSVPARGAATVAGSVLAVMFVLAFGNVVNDLADVESDRFGKARRPLPSGRLAVGQARVLAAGLAGAAITVTLVAARRQLAIVVAMGAVAALYSSALKRLPLVGNAVFASQCGATVVFGALAAGRPGRSAWSAAAIVTVGILCVEVAKTVEDYDADARVGTRSVAHLAGKAHQHLLVGSFTVAYLVVCGAAWSGAHRHWVVALASVPVLPLLAFAVTPDHGRDPAGRVPRFVVASKALWPLGLLALTGL